MRVQNFGTFVQMPVMSKRPHVPGLNWQNSPASHGMGMMPPHCLPRPTAWTLAGNEIVTTNAAAAKRKDEFSSLPPMMRFWFVLATRDYIDGLSSAMIADLMRRRVVRLSLPFGAKVLRTA